MSTRLQGTLHRWIDDRAFGFIRPHHGGDGDIFVHVTAFRFGTIPNVGARVEFDIGDDRGRTRAVDVEVLDGGTR